MSKRSENLYRALGMADEKYISEAEAVTPAAKKHKPIFKVAIAAALLSAIGIIVIAAAPVLRNFLNLPFVSENPKLDEIPDGYTGIYSAADLELVRSAPDENYILMSDIDLCGEYHTPIGTVESPFNGTFNGNGHKIVNFSIESSNADVATLYTGFFGYAPYGIIRNLGIENAHITVSDAASCYAGIIAGEAGYVAASYAENCTLTIDCVQKSGRSGNSIFAGGLCGNVYTIDSCYAVCDINIGGSINDSSTDLYAGKLAGLLYTAVTSWADVELDINCEGFKTGIAGLTRCCPKVVPASVFDSITAEIQKRGSTNKFNMNIFLAFYTQMSKEEANVALGKDRVAELFYYEDFDVSAEENFYVYAIDAKMREMMRTDDILRETFSEEELVEIFSSSYLKIGEIYCYDLEAGSTDYNGFDFNAVWTRRGTTPVLKIFDK